MQSLPAYPATALRIVEGANAGDPLGLADEMQLDDVCHLVTDRGPMRLCFEPDPSRRFRLSRATALGRPGHRIHLDCTLRLMAPTGTMIDVLVAVELDCEQVIHNIFALPMGILQRDTDYRIIAIDREEARRTLAKVCCVSLARGTRIMRADGVQRPVESLRPGDQVLTRDAGPQMLRWIGRRTRRADGAFAPIRIASGALNNLGPLMVSPDHRFFIYQRRDALGAGRNEVMVQAKHLVNGDTIRRAPGGYVDYYQLLLDTHQIIYAEGIAAETMMVDAINAPVLSKECQTGPATLAISALGHDIGLRRAFEVSEQLAYHPETAARLRQASM